MERSHHKRSKRRSRHKKRKNTIFLMVKNWITKDPSRLIAILCGVILIYLTILFIQYSYQQKKNSINTYDIPQKK